MHAPTDQQRLPGLAALWLSYLGGVAAWAVQLAIGYLLVTVDCANGVSGLRYWLLGLGLVTLLLALCTAAIGWRSWREIGGDPDTEAGGATGRSSYLALGGVALSLVFAFAIVLNTVASLVIAPCGG